MRIFGRNIGRPYASEYEDELERVLEAVTFVPEPLGEYEAWMPYTSIFQQTAYESQYGDIVVELARIESRVAFND